MLPVVKSVPALLEVSPLSSFAKTVKLIVLLVDQMVGASRSSFQVFPESSDMINGLAASGVPSIWNSIQTSLIVPSESDASASNVKELGGHIFKLGGSTNFEITGATLVATAVAV